MRDIESLDRIIKEIEEVGELIWKQDADAYKKLESLILKLGEAVNEFIVLIKQYKIEEINVEWIVNRLNNIITGFENKDEILLADTLNYEIYNIIMQYLDLLTLLKEEDNELL